MNHKCTNTHAQNLKAIRNIKQQSTVDLPEYGREHSEQNDDG